MPTYSIYIVDDEQSLAKGIALSLQKDYRTNSFTTAEKAIDSMTSDLPDLVLLDTGLLGMNGVDALRVIKKDYPETVVVMITAFEDVKTVIDKFACAYQTVNLMKMFGNRVLFHMVESESQGTSEQISVSTGKVNRR